MHRGPASCEETGGPRFDRVVRWAAARRSLLMAWLTLIALALAALALARLVEETNYDAVVEALFSIDLWRLGAALGFTATSFGALTLYDFNAFQAIGVPQPWRRIAPGAVAAYAVAQTAGFGPLSGGAIRLRYYTPLGVGPAEIARVVAFVTLAFGGGLAVTAALGALVEVRTLAPIVRVSEAWIAAAALATLVAAGLVLTRAGRRLELPGLGGRGIELPGAGMMLRQIAVTALDTAAAAGVLWVLLPSGSIGYFAFLPLFSVALVLGILSHVPAGLGVFEAVLLAAIGHIAPPAELLAGFALYRLIYQVLPLGLAAIGLTVAEVRRLTSSGPAAAALRAMTGLLPQVLATLALVLGAMLVFSGVTPARGIDLEWLNSYLPLPLIEGAHFLSSVLGALLMISARGLAFRLDGAWWTAILAACAALVLSLVKAVAIYEAAALAIFAVALLVSRPDFDRKATLLEPRLTAPWLAAVAAVLISALAILFFVFGHEQFGRESWLTFEISEEAPRGLRALFGASLLVGLAAVWSLLRPMGHRYDTGAVAGPGEIARAVAIIERQPAAAANLVRMGDKQLIFSEDGRGFVMYGRQGTSWIALFDPVGPLDVWPELIWRFVETAREAGGRSAFYQTTPELLALYADAGLRFYKLGEQARVDLAAFDLVGGKRAGQRNVLSRGAREGLVVDVLEPAAVPAVIDRLAEISAAWLAARGGGEKSFSLGAFDRDYVASQRCAVLRLGGEPVAFATLMGTAENEETAIDLMRHVEEIPNVAMEFLFLRLCEILKAEGCRWFDLGMAPLSGLSASEAAPFWHRLGRAIYEEGVPSYNFKGLRGFKSKLQPVWRPRYLAVAGGGSPALLLLDATRLIGRPPRETR
ncbi:MAG: bifunctional lysylphosphatidylglycerol flippase/synthetase MprF [Amaricoccus sp.]